MNRFGDLRLFVFLFLTLFSSLKSEWNFTYVLTPSKEFNSLRLFYKNPSSFELTSSQITVTNSGIHFILNLHLCPIEKEGDIDLTATLDDGSITCLKGHLYSGGEKIIIGQLGTKWMIDHLKQGKSIHLDVETYQTTINSLDFSTLWAKAAHLLVNDKIHLQLK